MKTYDGLPLLVDGLPEAVTVGDRVIPVRTDFRMGLLATSLLADRTLPEGVLAETFVKLFCGEVPEGDSGALLEALWRFYQGRYPQKGGFWTGRGSGVLSPVVDEGRLVASFWQAYGIDLFAVRMHWWVFLMLLVGLPAGTPMMDAVRVRLMEPVPGLDEEGRYRVRLAKRVVGGQHSPQ